MATATMTLATAPGLDREAWLADRRNRIGASEAAAALGISPFESPRELYLRKLGELPDVETNEAMTWGNLLEPVIGEEYERRTGRRIVDHQVEIRGQYAGAPIGATLDGMTDDGYPLEIKTISAWSSREIGEEGTDDLPEHWLIQAHQQMLLADAPRVDFAILVGGQRLEIRTVERVQPLIDRMIVGLGAFWACVERREPPAVLHKADRGLMHLIYPQCSGEIDLSPDDATAVDRWQELGKEVRELEETRGSYKTSILEALKGNAVGYLPDGRIVTRKIVDVAEQTITRRAYTYVDLRVRKGGAK